METLLSSGPSPETFYKTDETGSWRRYCLPVPAGRRHGRKRKALIIRYHLNNDVDLQAKKGPRIHIVIYNLLMYSQL